MLDNPSTSESSLVHRNMTVKGGTAPACAACKYQRRKCSPNCPLAPYFPANQPKMFQNVHRLFGVSNVTKTIQKLNSKHDKDDAMRSIIYESEMRARFPINGCSGVIGHLHLQLRQALLELHYVCAHLDAFRKAEGKSAFVLSSRLDDQKAYGVGHSHPCLMLDTFSDANANANPNANAMMMSSNLHGIQNNDIDCVVQQFYSCGDDNRTKMEDSDHEKKHSYFGSKMDGLDALEYSSPESTLDNGAVATEHGW